MLTASLWPFIFRSRSWPARLPPAIAAKPEQTAEPKKDNRLPIDLEQRRRRGEKVLLEHYLVSFPELGSAQDLPVELIAAEYRIRRLQGDPLRIEGDRKSVV